MQRTLFIGDVHGCLEELEALLAAAQVGPEDRVILVGDLLAKGPDSQGVLQLARERGFQAVLGNHDAAVLRVRHPDDAGRQPKAEHQLVAASLTPVDWEWLEALPLALRVPEASVVVAHAGLVPGVPLEQQRRDDVLNMRSLTPEGRPSRRIADGAPWASVWPGPEHVIFGHDAIRGLQQYPFATGLDTGCVYGKALTGLLLPERRLVSVPARRMYCSVE
jgi:diadenosine tetraphosphatase ApaH/serine/threonine PP2A family protein phosphatase